MDAAKPGCRAQGNWKLRLAREKTEVYTEFLGLYGEQATWQEWLEFLEERPELKGFGWARNLGGPAGA